MKYEKAMAEITLFGTWKVFMRLSSGKQCGFYGIIETYDGDYIACYHVERGYNQQTGYYTAICTDVEDGFPVGQATDITNVTFDPSYIMP